MADYSVNKGHYPTWEFRFFDMPRSTVELRLQVAFLAAWVRHHRTAIRDCYDEQSRILAYCPPITWNADYQDRLFRSRQFARAQIGAFWEKLGLNVADYESFWTERYVKRMENGEAK
jgi:hypothetical protein